MYEWEVYKEIQKKVKEEIRSAKRKFEQLLASKIKEDSKTFYSYVRSKQQIKSQVGPLKDEVGNIITSDMEAAEALNEFFKEVFTVEDSEIPAATEIYEGEEKDKLKYLEITEEMVMAKIRKLKNGKAAGLDGIRPDYIKTLAGEVVKPLTMIFQRSLQETKIPSEWKCANITPLYKKGPSSNVSNYRPVNLTSVPGKLMENILRDAIVDHLEKNKLINETQHGFRKAKSCVSNLLLYWNELTDYIDKGTPVDVVYLDLQKAFDTVPHKRLIAKIKAHGIDGWILKWIHEWLSERKQRVVLNGQISQWNEVSSSVVQGSVLGPVCFSMYMNDMEINLESSTSMFADDTKIIRPIVTQKDRDTLQNDLDKLMVWTQKWQMKFNVDKCSVLHFGYNNPMFMYNMDGRNLQSKTEEKDLGVYINTSMKFNKQCAESVKKANRVIGIIKRNFMNFDRSVIIKLYKSLVRPHLDYAIPVWRPYLKKDITLLENVQRRMTKLIPNLRHKTYEERLKELKLMTLEQRHIRQDLLTFYNIINKNMNINIEGIVEIIGSQKTRGNSFKIRPKHARLEIRKNTFFERIWKTWNELPEEVVSAKTINKFKEELQRYMIFKGHWPSIY